MHSGPWTCFHCGDTFLTEGDARTHFGPDETRVAACVVKAGAEGSLVRALRAAEDAYEQAMHAVHDETVEAVKAMRAQASRHRTQLAAAEEAGYERGLADALAISIRFDPAEAFADRLRQAIADRMETVTQRAVARQMGVSEARVSQIMRMGGNLTIESVERLLMSIEVTRSKLETAL